MEALLPTRSGSSRLSKKRSGTDRDIIESEQRTQDALNNILVEQINKNESLREDERKTLLANMDTMRSEVSMKLKNTSADYTDHGNELISITSNYTNTITNAINNMDLTLPKPDTSKIKQACDEVNQMIANLGKSTGASYELGVKTDGKGGGDAASLIRGNKQNIVKNVAEGQLGVRYVWGGVTPGVGLDCSGLTQYAYRTIGVNIPRVADDQLKSGIGVMVDRNNLQVGDQLFFGDGNEATHTGIYVGNGQMIHAPHRGAVVSYSPINSGYYQQRFMGAKRYAFGTFSSSGEIALVGDDRSGKLNQIRPELIVGKNGVRLAGQNGAEFVNLESGDQVIPYEKTKQILQRSDVSTPRYASGTVSPDAIAAYIKQKYPEITNAAIAGLLANIQQESSFVVDAKTVEAYGGGDNTPTARWGLFQLDDKRVPGWSNIVQNGTWQQQIDRAFQNGGYNSNENSGIGDDKHNVWKHVLTNSNLGAGQAARDWDYLFERSDGKSRETRAQNAEKYYQQLLDGTIDITNALNDNTNALENKVTGIQGFKDKSLDEINKATLYGRAAQLGLISDDNLSDYDKQLASLNIYKPLAEKAQQLGAESYKELLSEYIKWIEEVENGTAEYSQEVEDAYRDSLDDIRDSVIQYADKISEFKENILSYAEDKISDIDDYISERNTYNDWAKRNDSELAAIGRKVDILTKAYQANALSEKEYNKRMSEYRQDAYSTGISKLSDLFDRVISEAEQRAAKKKELLSLSSSRLSSDQTILQSAYNVTNAIAEAQHDINNELETSKSMYEYLDEDTRNLLFNQKDYNKLSATLKNIQQETSDIQARYVRDIQNAEKENIDEITSKYQMQLDSLMKQYEIEKARLEVAKKQQQLNNVLNERNVRMFIDGQWKWVANTQDVQNAKTELADAKYQVTQAHISANQQANLNDIQARQNALTTEMNLIDSNLEKYREQWERIQEQIDGEGETLASVLHDFANSDVPELRSIASQLSEPLANLYQSITGQAVQKEYYADNYLSKILDNALTLEEALELTASRNAKIDSANPGDEAYGQTKYSDEDITKLWNYAHNKDEIKPDANKDYTDAIVNALTEYDAILMNIERNAKIDSALPGDSAYGQVKYSYEEAVSMWEQARLAYETLNSDAEFWNKADQILKENSDNVNDAIVNLIEETIPSFRDVINQTSSSIVQWVKSITAYKVAEIRNNSNEPVLHYANGTKYTNSGNAELGENAWEAFFSKHSEFSPINNPILAKLPSGGVVFNQEQMSNVRKPLDLSNGNILQYTQYMKQPQAQSIDKSVDNSVNINGMKVDTTNSREFVEALRRFVNVH